MTDTRTIMACIDLSDYSPMTLGHGHGLELGTTRRYQGHRLLRLGPDIIHFKKPSLGFGPNHPARDSPKEVPMSPYV